MTGADWIILVIVLLAVVHAASNGFFQEAFAIAGLVVGYLLAAWRYERVAAWFLPYLKSPWLGELAGFFLIFAGVLIVAGIAGRITRWIAKEAGLSVFDRVLGGGLGLIKGSLIVAVLLVGMTAFAPMSKWSADSELAPYFLVFGRAAIWMAPSELRARFYQGLELLHHPGQPPPTNTASVGPAK